MRGRLVPGFNISDKLFLKASCTNFFLAHFNVICDALVNRRTEAGNLFVK